MEVNIHRAKTNLSRLILKAESGEEVVIARAGKPVVRLVPVELQPPANKRKAGALKDVLRIAPDAFSLEVDEEIARLFNESPLLYTDGDVKAEIDAKDKSSGKKRKRKKWRR